eukprot:TRINITY_DN10494_c0_g1_i13.p1 TRINITY_DN10494_c0_g1~~TRINITY_DN10494_c0_g1_i13.p1  ORF type:complete len:159 (+),score=19.89 TRINITY_DN10494_c0_g1_i13:73-549(+)
MCIRDRSIPAYLSGTYISSLHNCMSALSTTTNDLSLKPVMSLISKANEAKHNEIDHYLYTSLAVGGILLTGFCVLEESVLNVHEIPTFFCRVLTDYKTTHELFRKLKVPVKKRFKLQGVCTAISLLVKVSMGDVMLSLIHICRCRRIERCRSRWSPYH